MAELDAVALHGMQFHTLIGVLPHEREHAQPLEIDLTAWIPRGSGVLDYRDLYGRVREAVESQGLLYLEELADSIAARILEESAVDRVEISLRKPHAAVGGPIAFAQVTIVRERDG